MFGGPGCKDFVISTTAIPTTNSDVVDGTWTSEEVVGLAFGLLGAVGLVLCGVLLWRKGWLRRLIIFI